LPFFHTPPSREPNLLSLSILAANPSASATAAVQSLVLGLVGIAILLRARGRLRGTTLTAAWGWALASVIALTTVAVGLATVFQNWPIESQQALNFAAATTTFCPLMAVLGAKRPQHRAWQWIVLALWVVLSLPAGEWLLFHRGAEVHAARSWFLVILIAVGTLNYLPTRFWLASLLFAVGEVVLLAEFLPGGHLVVRLSPHLALGSLVSALAAAAWLSGRRAADAEPLNRLWRDFRNLIGMVWAFRVAERVNFLAEHLEWNVRLRWPGFQTINGRTEQAVTPEIRDTVTKNLRSMLLPFVSAEWIAQRLDDRPPETGVVRNR
jgi:hypothetical protein